MRDRITAIIAIVLLTSLAALTYWYSQSSRYAFRPTPVSPEGPDFVVDGVTLTQFDVAGRATNRLFAARMTHFAHDDRIDLDAPRVVSLRPDQPQLEARAATAQVLGGGERLLLQGDVVLTRAAGADGTPPMRVTTQELLVLPDHERYSSPVDVLVERGSSTIQSIGMDYDHLSRVVRFHSRVRGTVAPAEAKG